MINFKAQRDAAIEEIKVAITKHHTDHTNAANVLRVREGLNLYVVISYFDGAARKVEGNEYEFTTGAYPTYFVGYDNAQAFATANGLKPLEALKWHERQAFESSLQLAAIPN